MLSFNFGIFICALFNLFIWFFRWSVTSVCWRTLLPISSFLHSFTCWLIVNSSCHRYLEICLWIVTLFSLPKNFNLSALIRRLIEMCQCKRGICVCYSTSVISFPATILLTDKKVSKFTFCVFCFIFVLEGKPTN